MNVTKADLPRVRGVLREQVALKPLTWLRVGGPATAMFYPADEDDLCSFLASLDPSVPVLPMGVASNLLVRDGGIHGVVVRFSGALSRAEVDGATILAGPGALDQRVSQVAQRAGLSGLEFLIGIPGTIGGAVRMNAGAFGGETGDRLLWIESVDRSGRRHRLSCSDIGFTYRRSGLPADHIVVRAAFSCVLGDANAIAQRMEAIRVEREASQPLRVATGGSTFKNPAGDKAWRLIDEAGCRGLRNGAAEVSQKHCNFLINTGAATAKDLEDLGETVRQRVRATSGIQLEWEILRVGSSMDLPQ